MKIRKLGIILLVLLFAVPCFGKARWYNATVFLGGTTGAADSINGQNLVDGDRLIVTTTANTYFYLLDDDSAATEDSAGYTVIKPDSNAGDKRWVIVNYSSAIKVVTAATDIILTGDQMNGIVFMTDDGEVLLPDVCDSATGQWAMVMNKTATKAVEVAVADTAADKFVLIDGTATGVNDEIDLSTDASSWVKVVCLEANTWYVVSGVGVTTDGGVAD
jgi:hypothetical protein